MPEQPSIGLELYWQDAFKVLERIRQTQAEAIRRAALLFADCIEKNGSFRPMERVTLAHSLWNLTFLRILGSWPLLVRNTARLSEGRRKNSS